MLLFWYLSRTEFWSITTLML